MNLVLDQSREQSRQLPQFRVTLNARCGRSCFFCRPSGEAVPTAAGAEIDVDDLIRVGGAIRRAGITGIKLTGGDPALYPPLVEAVERLRGEAGFETIELISRHPRLGDLADGLAAAGVTMFNVSLDTLDPRLHTELCGVDDLDGIRTALDRCVATGVDTKVNMVVMGGVNDAEVPDMVRYCEEHGVRTLKLLDVISDLDQGAESYARRLAIRRGATLKDLYAPLAGTVARYRDVAVSRQVRAQGGLGHPMTVLTLPSGVELVIKDGQAGAWRGSVCEGCQHNPCHDALMALRLTADLRAQFCLLRDDNVIDLAPVLGDPDGSTYQDLDALVAEMLAVYRTATFVGPDNELCQTVAGG